jgi:hypothetical protein
MNPDEDKNTFLTAEAIADHLAHAWSYSATLRGLQHYSRKCPAILDRNGHFVATITYGMWYSLGMPCSRLTSP